MTAARWIQTYFVSLLTFLVIDLVWLGIVARGFYREHLGELLAPDVRWLPAILFYMMYVAAVLFFAVAPALERMSLGRAILLGGFFGMIAYATYDLTNLATLRGFPTTVAVVDIAWGFILTASVAAAGYLFAARGGP